MKNVNKVLIWCSLLLVLLTTIPVFTQVKKSISKQNKIERYVTITHKKGYSLTGILAGASSAGIKVTSDKQVFNFKWDEISNISFMNIVLVPTSTNVKKSVPIKKSPAIENALKALRKLEAAIDVGLNQQEYNRRVIDATAEVNELLSSITDGCTKNEIKNALSYHKLASSFWNRYIVTDSDYRISKEEFDEMLQKCWKEAGEHLNNATRGEPKK